jgi:hypothetical protein
MDSIEKSLNTSIAQINVGFLILFGGLFLFANEIEYFYDSLPISLLLLALVIFVPSVVIALGANQFLAYKEFLKPEIKMKRLTYAELVPNVLAFALLGLGAYLLSFYESRPVNSPYTSYIFIHTYQSQAMILFLGGTGLLALTLSLYYYLLPKQIVGQPKSV